MKSNTKVLQSNVLPTWEELVAVEPDLIGLEAAARKLKPGNWRGWERIKADAKWLVGWHANKSSLRTCQAYNGAIDHLLNVWEGQV